MVAEIAHRLLPPREFPESPCPLCGAVGELATLSG